MKRRGGLRENEARWFFQQLIIGMDYSHRKGVVNRDIKLENTLLDGSKRPLVKICDFGYSKNLQDSLPKSKVGTPGYTGARLLHHPQCHWRLRAAPGLLSTTVRIPCTAAPEIITRTSHGNYDGKLVDGTPAAEVSTLSYPACCLQSRQLLV